ncbi:MAG: SMC-Scp complex subunit ScpB [Gammaproteobacteria bacterium]|nr:SMC-Scp complex subunit ScpB [Gammaproteobacteria bacterium]
MNTERLKKIVEGFLFASDKALSAEQIVKLFPEGEQPEKEQVSLCIESLIDDFETHGIELKQVKSGYRFQVRQETASWVSRLWDEKPAKYTRAMLETLALIVYRQPITRGEIEEIRGVSVSSHIIRTMMERDWIKVIGHRDVPGRPALYASTREFLDYFNLSSLEELPPLSEIKDLDSIATELDPEQNAALISAIREMQKDQASEETESAIPGGSVMENLLDENIEAADESESKETKETSETSDKQEMEFQQSEIKKSFSDLVSNFGKSDRDDTDSEAIDPEKIDSDRQEFEPEKHEAAELETQEHNEDADDNDSTSDVQKNSVESDAQ